MVQREEESHEVPISRILLEPTENSNNCYLYMVDPSKRRVGKNASAIMYPDLPSSIAPVPHCPERPIPTPPERKQPSSEESSESKEEVDVDDIDYKFTGAASEKNLYFSNHRDLNDLIRDLGLTKSNAQNHIWGIRTAFLSSIGKIK